MKRKHQHNSKSLDPFEFCEQDLKNIFQMLTNTKNQGEVKQKQIKTSFI
jgi:hypothetical protein